MKTGAIVLLAVAVAALGLLVYRQSISLREQEHQVQGLAAKLSSMLPSAGSLDLQEKCAKQADAQYAAERAAWEGQRQKITSYVNHYNSKLGKCFIEIRHSPVQKKSHELDIDVLDSFEGKVRAEYWSTEGAEVKTDVPLYCYVRLPSGEERFCHTYDEFEELEKQLTEQ